MMADTCRSEGNMYGRLESGGCVRNVGPIEAVNSETWIPGDRRKQRSKENETDEPS
jgi:hypothetical protein